MESPILDPDDGQILVHSIYLSVDPIEIGGLMGGGAVGEVVASHNPAFKDGDIVEGYFGWQEYESSEGSKACKLRFQLWI